MGRKQKPSLSIGPDKVTRSAIKWTWLNGGLLGAALLAALIVYWPVLQAGWFYDDGDYVVNDPRLNHLDLFLPWNMSQPPPPLDADGGILRLPGYDKPLVADRYVWRLSFALERRLFGASYSPSIAHGVNLTLHLVCVALLFFAAKALARLYASRSKAGSDPKKPEGPEILFPGLCALIFAVLPWAAEPVVYVSARNGGLGALFTLLGLIAFIDALNAVSRIRWGVSGLAAFLCCVAAFGSKENFISAPAGILLVTAPVLLTRLKQWPRKKAIILGAVVLLLLVLGIAVGIRGSERAMALLHVFNGARNGGYLFSVQSPILLQVLGDQPFGQRLSLEFNHPGWSDTACWAALLLNIILIFGSLIAAIRYPLALAITWFYLHLLPTNSILVRQDFLAARNVYLPTVGIAVLFAGLVVWLMARNSGTENAPAAVFRKNRFVAAGALGLLVFWAVTTGQWASAFRDSTNVWARSAQVAPDHAAVRLNHALAMYSTRVQSNPSAENVQAVEKEMAAAIEAEKSPTMRYYEEWHRTTRAALSARILGRLRLLSGDTAKAEEYFRKSFSVKPTLGTWLEWFQLCLEQNLDDGLRDAEIGATRQWPRDWWTVSARAMRRAKDLKGRVGSDIKADLESAERAADSPNPELRRFQARVLFGLAHMAETPEILRGRLDRLGRLGMPPESLAKLHEKLAGR